MIPLLLRLRGLHSFREEQVLDFGDVLGYGVFGIFGPTGSGKSTVCDAITLALYGRVERAPSGTQGIINQAEERLDVDFAFELRGPEGSRRYRAQRSFARQGPEALRTAKCRLSTTDPGGTVRVLAEKERDMTRLVGEILGLTAEDFTRAVVLPQGRFAEFLRLAGAERRRMLQRLFSLEQYGDVLATRVKERIERAEHERDGVAAELTGLGDASGEALCGAEQAHAAASDRAAAAAAALQAARAEHESWARVWGWQAELSAVAAAGTRLEAEVPEARRAEAELRAAERAERVRPLLEAVVEARAGLEAARRRSAEARAASAGLAERLSAARLALESARRLWQERQAPLQEQRVLLAAAVQTEADLAVVRERRQVAASTLAAAEDGRTDAEEAAARAETARGSARRREQAAALQLQAVQVTPVERARVEAAARALREFRRAEAARRRAEEGVAQAEAGAAQREVAASAGTEARALAEQTHAAAEGARRDLGEAPDRPDAGAWTEALRAASQALEDVRRGMAEVLRAEGTLAGARASAAAAGAARALAEAAWARAGSDAARAASALEEARGHSMAGLLAARLHPGGACPVCGSTQHPLPAAGDGSAEMATAERGLNEADAAYRAVQVALDAARAREAAALGTQASEDRSAARAHAALGQAREGLGGALARLPEAARTLGVERLGAYLQAEESALRSLQAARVEWQAALQGVERRRQTAFRSLISAQQREAERRAAAASATGSLAAAREACLAAAAEAGEAATALEAARAGLSDADIERAQADLAGRDAQARGLLEGMPALSAAVEAADRALADAGRRLAAAQTEALQSRDALGRLSDEAARLRGEVERATGGAAPASAQLAAVETALRSLRAAEAEAQQGAERAETASAAARADAAAAEAEWTGAGLGAEAAERRLAAALAAAEFAGEAAARDSFRDAATQAELRARVATHDQERVRLAAERTRLLGLLCGRSLAPGEWEERQRGLAATEAEARAAQEGLGVAQEALLQLRARYARWRELQARRTGLEGMRAHLSALQTVLRGGAFVEFIAEEQLRGVALDASARLGQLTRFRYALEVDAQGGFCVRDDWGGGTRRPVTTLSGGETFLASLALALALSAQIQLRGRYPLQFFFLDEGFGTLDPEALDTAMAALERLEAERVHIGVISHLPEVRARLARRVVVEPAEPGGRGSRLRIEVA